MGVFTCAKTAGCARKGTQPRPVVECTNAVPLTTQHKRKATALDGTESLDSIFYSQKKPINRTQPIKPEHNKST